ncbi:Zinc finger protein ZAT3 [Linum perenne]
MALIVDQQSRGELKHFCKICNKGFGCGRALGGHMRAHGIGDDITTHMEDEDDEDEEGPMSDNNYNNVGPANKRMYALRTNPNRLKSTRVCENCGREFLSWKSFLDHENGKCTSVDEAEGDEENGIPIRDGGTGNNWSKRKRSFRAKIIGGNNNNNNNYGINICPSSEEEDLANCLMMLSNAVVDNAFMAEPEESSASASKDDELYHRANYPINFVPPTAMTYRPAIIDKAKGTSTTATTSSAKGLFECKACKKVFNSHQALGGHRASHKKVKGCFAARLDNHQNEENMAEDYVIATQQEQQYDDTSFFPSAKTTSSSSSFQLDNNNNNTVSSSSKRKSKVHECSICHRVFSSGQALGGHKRCHWITSNSSTSPTTISVDQATSLAARFNHFQDHLLQIQQRPKFTTSTTANNNDHEAIDLRLDLNLPASNTTVNRQPPPTSFECSPPLIRKENNNKDPNYHDEEISSKKSNKTNHNNDNGNGNGNGKVSSISEIVEDEADSKVKLAKLSELKDIKATGNSSPWLQVGIGSTANP